MVFSGKNSAHILTLFKAYVMSLDAFISCKSHPAIGNSIEKKTVRASYGIRMLIKSTIKANKTHANALETAASSIVSATENGKMQCVNTDWIGLKRSPHPK